MLYYQTKYKNQFLGEVAEDDPLTLTNSLNIEDRNILNNPADSIISLHMEQDSPAQIKIVNVDPADNEDLHAIQDTDGTFVAEDSEEDENELNQWQQRGAIPPITIN